MGCTLGYRWAAFWQGVHDGWAQPQDLTQGMTYQFHACNFWYDFGANVGQFWGRLFHRETQ